MLTFLPRTTPTARCLNFLPPIAMYSIVTSNQKGSEPCLPFEPIDMLTLSETLGANAPIGQFITLTFFILPIPVPTPNLMRPPTPTAATAPTLVISNTTRLVSGPPSETSLVSTWHLVRARAGRSLSRMSDASRLACFRRYQTLHAATTIAMAAPTAIDSQKSASDLRFASSICMRICRSSSATASPAIPPPPCAPAGWSAWAAARAATMATARRRGIARRGSRPQNIALGAPARPPGARDRASGRRGAPRGIHR